MQRWSDFVKKINDNKDGDDVVDLRDEETPEEKWGSGRHLDVLIPEYLVERTDKS